MKAQVPHPFRLSSMVVSLLLLVFHSASTALAQTIVRFNTPLGAMDVELFDKDKPVTVANFLNYVTNGLYKDMFFHRWEPGFVLQGGGYAVARRGSTNEAFTLFKNFGTITNEYAVGSKRSNVFGTIAMAKLGGNPNSASSEWFFNLGDNSSNLDNQNGGFTVFGHVIAGTNVLHRFNNATDPENGIFRIDLTSVTTAFAALPVLSNRPTFNDLVYADIVVLSKGSAPAIAAQPLSQTVIAGEPVQFFVSAAGSATLRYQWSLNDVPIPNETNAFLRLPEAAASQAGRYTVRVVNDLGSATSNEAILVVRLKLITKVQGSGAVSRDPDLESYDPGASVNLGAKPSAGWRFMRWEGSSNNATPLWLITLQANQTVIAVFEQIQVQPFPIDMSKSPLGSVELSFPGLDRAIYEFETSSDLRSWASWLRLTNTTGNIRVTDSKGPSLPALFYRGKFAGFAE